MKRSAGTGAFSLIEVVLAIAVFALAAGVTLALLPALSRQSGMTSGRAAAAQLPDAVKLELERSAAGDLSALALQMPTMDERLENGLALVATRDGRDVRVAGDAAAPAEAERFFLVECWRLPAGAVGEPAEGPGLPVLVRVAWPYPSPPPGQDFSFVLALTP